MSKKNKTQTAKKEAKKLHSGEQQSVLFGDLQKLVLQLLQTNLRLQIIDVDQPTSGSTVIITPTDPLDCKGTVRVEGTASMAGASLVSIIVDINGDQTFATGSANWGIDAEGAEEGDNDLIATAEWEINGEVIEETDTVDFTGTCNGAMTTQSSSRSSAASDVKADLVEPSSVQDGWLEYHNVLQSNPFDRPKTLGYGGKPLSASLIAVHAGTVAWRHHSVLPVRRPLGSGGDVRNGLKFPNWRFTVGSEPFRFKQTPKYGLCVVQTGRNVPHRRSVNLVDSSIRDQPDVFNLVPGRPIRVCVNDCRYPNTAVHSGMVSIYVKVLV